MTNVHADGPAINSQRLWASLQEMAQLGAYHDEATGLTGVNRLTMTDADVSARRLLISWLEEAGLTVRIDPIGNIFGRREGTEAQARPVMLGSHLDSVPTAGAFDGPLGVLGALEVMRALNDSGQETRRPLEVACFTEEEGVRFGTDMLGSAVAVGRVPLAQALSLSDRAGVQLGSELARTGFAGSGPHLLPAPFAYLECHIEQGPVLGSQGLDIGVVTGTQGISWQEVTINGRQAHAGATPIEFRLDAGLAAARLVTHLRAMVDSGTFGSLRATVGQLELAPGAVNIVPGSASLTVDLRNPDDELMSLAELEVQRFLVELGERQPGLQIRTRFMAKTGQVSFDAGVQETICQVVKDMDLRYDHLLSGAGHDAQELASLCPTGMIFVPGEYDGVSHSPREYSSPEACAQGIQVLANTTCRLAASD